MNHAAETHGDHCSSPTQHTHLHNAVNSGGAVRCSARIGLPVGAHGEAPRWRRAADGRKHGCHAQGKTCLIQKEVRQAGEGLGPVYLQHKDRKGWKGVANPPRSSGTQEK